MGDFVVYGGWVNVFLLSVLLVYVIDIGVIRGVIIKNIEILG